MKYEGEGSQFTSSSRIIRIMLVAVTGSRAAIARIEGIGKDRSSNKNRSSSKNKSQ